MTIVRKAKNKKNALQLPTQAQANAYKRKDGETNEQYVIRLREEGLLAKIDTTAANPTSAYAASTDKAANSNLAGPHYTYNAIQQPKFAFHLGDTEVWGSGERALDTLFFTPTLLLQHEDRFFGRGSAAEVQGNEAARAMLPAEIFDREPAIVTFSVPDGHTLQKGAKWWKALTEGIRALPKGSRVVVTCIGGHGRTGTALSLLAWFGVSPVLDPKVKGREDIVQWIRTNYSDAAVETETQLSYIEKVTGQLLDRATDISDAAWGGYGGTGQR